MEWENINRILQVKYLPVETGYRRLPGGQMYIAVLTRMNGCKVRWLNMWLKNYAQKEFTDKRLPSDSTKLSRSGKVNLGIYEDFHGKYVMDKIIDNSHLVLEDPNKYFDAAKLKERNMHVFMCGHTLADGIITEHTLQIVRDTEYGCEMRCYYWINECTDEEAQNRIEHYITDIGNLAEFMRKAIENYKKQFNKPDIICKFCFSDDVVKNGLRKSGQYWICKSCGHRFINNNALPYMRYPYNIIAKAVNDHFYDKQSLNDIRKYISTHLNEEPSNSTMYGWFNKLMNLSLK